MERKTKLIITLVVIAVFTISLVASAVITYINTPNRILKGSQLRILMRISAV